MLIVIMIEILLIIIKITAMVISIVRAITITALMIIVITCILPGSQGRKSFSTDKVNSMSLRPVAFSTSELFAMSTGVLISPPCTLKSQFSIAHFE